MSIDVTFGYGNLQEPDGEVQCQSCKKVFKAPSEVIVVHHDGKPVYKSRNPGENWGLKCIECRGFLVPYNPDAIWFLKEGQRAAYLLWDEKEIWWRAYKPDGTVLHDDGDWSIILGKLESDGYVCEKELCGRTKQWRLDRLTETFQYIIDMCDDMDDELLNDVKKVATEGLANLRQRLGGT